VRARKSRSRAGGVRDGLRRYALNQNTIWQTDFVTWSLVAATFIGARTCC